MKIVLYGDTESTTGFGVHTKELKKALEDEGVEILRNETVNLPAVSITGIESLQLWSGNRHKPLMPYLIFEGDKLPNNWVKVLNEPYVTKILAPSKHVIETAKKSGVTKELILTPHGIDNKVFNNQAKPLDEIPKDLFKFLYVGGWCQGMNDRKGFQYLIKAFSEEFKLGEKVTLVVKFNSSYNPNINYAQEINNLNLPKNGLNIIIIDKELNKEDVARVYSSCDCFVMPTRGEAFGMTIAEAMSCGLPVITTNYGGQTDYVNETNGWLINVKEMTPSLSEPKHIYEYTKWAVPDVEHLKKLMRYAFEHKDECKNKGLKGMELIHKEYTWTKTADIIIKEANKP